MPTHRSRSPLLATLWLVATMSLGCGGRAADPEPAPDGGVVGAGAAIAIGFTSTSSSLAFGDPAATLVLGRSGSLAGALDVTVSLGGSLTVDGALVAGGGSLTTTVGAATGPFSSSVSFPAGAGTATLAFTPPASAPAGVSAPASLVFVITGAAPASQAVSIQAGKQVHTVTVSAGASSSASTCAPTATPAVLDTTTAFTLSANCTNGPTSYAWTSPSGAPPMTGASQVLGPIAVPGTYTWSVTATNGAGQSLPASVSVTVNAGPLVCTTTATHTLAYPNHTFYVDQTRAGETTAVSLNMATTTLLAGLGKFTIAESTSTGATTDVQFSVSACPGDFSPAASVVPCGMTTFATGGSVTFSIGPRPAGTPNFLQVCELPVGTSTVYFNFRQVLKGPGPTPALPLTPSCTAGTTCPVYVQLN